VYDATMPLPPRPDRHVFPTLPRRPIRVVLDGVTMLPNIGTMFRLCDAFRIERLFVCGGADVKPHQRKLAKPAAGTIGWVPFEVAPDALSVVQQARADGYTIAVIELADDSVAPHEMHTDRPLCLVVGAERHGISPAVLALADQRIEIPTDGLGGSINLTTAAAIVLYEAARRYPLPAADV
jgi:tRNA G18 (ribose-2'-O)-methylase SpoU